MHHARWLLIRARRLQQIQNVEQQARAASNFEFATAQAEYDAHMARQRAVLDRLDLSGLIDQLRARLEELDKGEDEREALEGGGNGVEAPDAREVKALVDAFRAKRAAYHEADIQAAAAAQLRPR
jgi:hypothetical protein